MNSTKNILGSTMGELFHLKFSARIAILTSLFTILTFAVAIMTPPVTGPFATIIKSVYPYTDTASRFPRDFYWMYPAIILNALYLILMICVNEIASEKTKLFSKTAVLFAVIASATLIINYFVQLTVIQPSLLNGEYDGISLLSQYNPHGLFIALEEIGFLMMSLSFVLLVPVFSQKDKLSAAIRRIFIAGFILTLASLILISILYGVNREYRFEVSAISINWLLLIIAGFLLSKYFKKV
ncbi:hypothetical protein JXQ31_15825 [candidate division KSB1 bacterium]|nr:hypothetical protein [candidate division KSB1 bacterium]